MNGFVLVLAGLLIAFGAILLIAAILNSQLLRIVSDFEWVDKLFGENAARILDGVTGIVFLVAGIVMLVVR